MSILVKSVEIPKEHPLYITLRPDGSVQVWNSYSGDIYGTQAIHVPEHGDLVDKQYAYQNTMILGEHTRKIVLKQIDALPVVIPADKEEEGIR